MGLFDKRAEPISDDPSDWVYEGHYKHAGRVVSFKFNPSEGAHPEEHARSVVFQSFKDDSGAIRDDLYSAYLEAQSTLSVKKHHQIGR